MDKKDSDDVIKSIKVLIETLTAAANQNLIESFVVDSDDEPIETGADTCKAEVNTTITIRLKPKVINISSQGTS